MAMIKSDKIVMAPTFQFDLCPGWTLNIDRSCTPIMYTLTHGKKSMTLTSSVVGNLCIRNYGLRLVKNRKQMYLPPEVLQSFSEHQIFLQWFDPDSYGNDVTDDCNSL